MDVFLTRFSGLSCSLDWDGKETDVYCMKFFLAFTLKWAVLLVLFVLIWDLSPSLLYLR